ncbi:MAG: hypothetical protein ACHQAV_00915 [Solirubrobacterales bacterium]
MAVHALAVATCALAATPLATAQGSFKPEEIGTLGKVPVDCGVEAKDYADPTCLTQTRNGTFALSPHVAHAGGTLTGTVAIGGCTIGGLIIEGSSNGPKKPCPISWPETQASPSSSYNPNLKPITKCGSEDTSCVWEVSKKAPTTQYTIMTVGITSNQGTGISKDYYAIIGKDQFELAGHIKDDAGKPVPGVRVDISGPRHVSVTTDATGLYNAILRKGTYRVTPSLTSEIFRPESASTFLIQDRTVDFKLAPDIHEVTLKPDQGSLQASGSGVDGITITDKDAHGEPVTGQTVKIEPPLTYDIPALICDDSGRLVYPSMFSDGSLFGGSFQRITDGAGQIHLTTFFGTVPGEWLIEAGEPEAPFSQRGHLFVTIDQAGGPATLPFYLASLLIAAGNSTLANFQQAAQRNVLQWLGEIKTGAGPGAGALNGIGFVPIHATDPAGFAQAGVVLFAENPGVRQRVFDYLSGRTSAPPPDTEAVVIDITNLKQLLLGTRLAGQTVNNPPYRLPSLSEWANGTVIQISNREFQALEKETHIPIPARGRPHLGIQQPQPHEALLYSYGPYPPFGGSPSIQDTFNRCVAPTFSTSVAAHSPVSLVVRDAHGNTAGVNAHGQARDAIPGALVNYSGKVVHSIKLPSGSYSIVVVGTGSGHATLVLDSQSSGGTVARVFSFRVRRGASGQVAVNGGRIAPTMRFGGTAVRATGGLSLSVRGLPRQVRKGQKVRLSLRVRDEFDRPASAVTLRISGVAGALSAYSDTVGRIALTLRPRRPGRIALSFSGPGYQALARRVQVSKR